jgi:hypothetical protein
MKVPVTQRALTQRINRQLRAKNLRLMVSRGANEAHDLGKFYTLNLQRNAVDHKHIDLEEYGRKIGVLQPFEALAKEA